MIKIVRAAEELTSEREKEFQEIGFVPTMGNLHIGHLSLLERGLDQFETMYVSIFVNPKQFGPNEDFSRYPRTLEQDIKLIESLTKKYQNKKIIVFAPASLEDVYPPNDNQSISVCGLSSELEGKLRPGHFDGVANVVYRLFNLIRPHAAYFGLKDFQQYLVIKNMVQDLQLPIEVIGMPIIRENSGLALSSRNQYLNEDEKQESLILYKTISQIKNIIAGKRENIDQAMTFINTALEDPRWNYLEIRDSESFSVDIQNSKKISIVAVYQIGSTRLLDNMQAEVE